jgi:hypothetical protein
MTREEHLAWVRERALEYVALGDLKSAIASLISDLGKHEETGSIDLDVLRESITVAQSGDPERARRWIETFK